MVLLIGKFLKSLLLLEVSTVAFHIFTVLPIVSSVDMCHVQLNLQLIFLSISLSVHRRHKVECLFCPRVLKYRIGFWFLADSPPLSSYVLTIMDWLYVLLKLAFMTYLILTNLAALFNSIMDWLYVLLKLTFLTYLIVTNIASVFNSIMDRLHMWLRVAFLTYLIVTILTTVFNSIVNRLYVLFKLTFLTYFIVTKLTTVFNSVI